MKTEKIKMPILITLSCWILMQPFVHANEVEELEAALAKLRQLRAEKQTLQNMHAKEQATFTKSLNQSKAKLDTLSSEQENLKKLIDAEKQRVAEKHSEIDSTKQKITSFSDELGALLTGLSLIPTGIFQNPDWREKLKRLQKVPENQPLNPDDIFSLLNKAGKEVRKISLREESITWDKQQYLLNIISLGYALEYAVSNDGKVALIRQPGKGWQKLDKKWSKALISNIKILRRQIIPEFSSFPLPASLFREAK